MNAKELLERFDFAGFNPHANDTVLRALRLLAAAEANDGSTPETDAEWRAMGDLARRLERERNALAARVRECEEDAARYRWLRDGATQDQLYKMPDWPDVEWDGVIDDARGAHD